MRDARPDLFWISFFFFTHLCLVEFATISLDSRTGKPSPRIFKPADIDRLLEREGLAKPKTEEDASAATTSGEAMAVDS